jgi:hypothetical protein
MLLEGGEERRKTTKQHGLSKNTVSIKQNTLTVLNPIVTTMHQPQHTDVSAQSHTALAR